jgi:DNA ligase-1
MILFGKEDIEGILEELEQTTGTNAKIALIAKHKENESLKAFFDVALNPYRIYHVKKLPMKLTCEKTSINMATIEDVYSLGGLAKYLEKKKALKNADRDLIYYYFDGLNTNLKKKWAEKAILKKPIAGVSVKTVNKAYGRQVVPEYNLLLMSSWKEGYNKFKFPVYVQRKLDGYRFLYIPGIGFLGRNGKPIANINLPTHLKMGKVVTIGKNFLNDLNCVFDSELYSHKRTFNEISSILSSEDKLIPSDIKCHVFNIIPIEEWNQEKVSGTYTDQIQLFQILKMAEEDSKVVPIDTYLCHNAEDLKALYDSFLVEGYEGAIVRAIEFVYAWKRMTAKSNTITKLKPFDYVDAKIIGLFEGQGSMIGMLGGFNIELEDNTQLKVGSGFKEQERIDLWNRGNTLIGEWVRIKYTEKTPDGSLRFPVFDNLRDSKD